MPGSRRLLPDHPSLRFLKLEAKRRLAAGEFPTLNDAQAAIAREHGLAGWAALKRLVESRQEPESEALSRLRWVIARFRDADAPGWPAPAAEELREHFGDAFLARLPPEQLVATIIGMAPRLRGEPEVIDQAPLSASARIADLRFDASVEAEPPHRITGLSATPVVARATDARLAAPPPARGLGDVPAAAAEAAGWGFAELGLAGLALAGAGPDGRVWVLATGWADLERGEILDTGQRLPASGISALVTATAVLRLVADGRCGLDRPANDHLRTVRLADDTITVRELLCHTAGVADPAVSQLFADEVPELVSIVGPVVASAGTRGSVRPSNGGYAVLGQLVADITGTPYADAAAHLVLDPLGMGSASFPASAAEHGPHGVTGYRLGPGGDLVPVEEMICTIPAAGGLWASAADLVRLGTGWSSLLPPALARDALTAQTPPGPGGQRVGLGWLISPDGDLAVHAGAGGGTTAVLVLRIPDGRVHLAMTNRLTPLDPINARIMRSWGDPHASDRQG
jgi:CubicO group peptidase (beta-lactamase class C family)